MRFLTMAFAAMLLAFQAAADEPVRVEDPSHWIRIEAGPITVLSDAGERRAIAVAKEIETFRAVLERTTRNLDARTDRKTIVFVFRDGTSLAPFRAPSADGAAEVRGKFFRRDGVNYVVFNATPPRQVKPVPGASFDYPNRELLHEWTHLVLADSFPALPRWVNEGIAEYFSTLRINRRFAEVGRASVYRAFDAVRGRPLPVETMFKVRNIRQDLPDDEQAFRFYSQSWAIVHYCLRGSEERKKEFGLFLGALQRGWPQDAAWKASFTATPNEILSEALVYVSDGRFTYARHPTSEIKIPKSSPPQPVSPADLLAELGRLAFVSRTDEPDQAGARFEAAVAIDPHHVRALQGLAEVRKVQGRSDEAAKLLREAAAAAPGAEPSSTTQPAASSTRSTSPS